VADQKLTELAAEATPTNDDIMYIVDDPAGVGIGPTSKKVEIETLFKIPKQSDVLIWIGW